VGKLLNGKYWDLRIKEILEIIRKVHACCIITTGQLVFIIRNPFIVIADCKSYSRSQHFSDNL